MLRGRASRAEFWWFTLFSAAALLLTGFLDLAVVPEGHDRPPIGWPALTAEFANYPVSSLLEWLLLPAGVAVFWRRLNDIGWPGWLALSFALITVLTYLIAPDSSGADQFMVLLETQGRSWLGRWWYIMVNRVGAPFIVLGLLQLLAGALYIVAGLRSSAPRNAHGPHPYAVPESHVFR